MAVILAKNAQQVALFKLDADEDIRSAEPGEKQMAVQHFYRELDLNEDQARAIEAILDEFIMQQADLMDRYRNTRLSGHDRILQILNDDQKKRFKKVLSELQNQTQRKD